MGKRNEPCPRSGLANRAQRKRVGNGSAKTQRRGLVDEGFKLARYDAARKALDEVLRIDEVKKIRDLAVAAQVYAKQAKDKELIDRATDLRHRAEIKAGETLKKMAEDKERHSGRGHNAVELHQVTPPPTLADLGITKAESFRWQQLAALPEKEREEKISKAKHKALNALDRKTVLDRAELQKADAKRVKALKPIEGKFRALVVDPPWDMEKIKRDERPNQVGFDFPPMSPSAGSHDRLSGLRESFQALGQRRAAMRDRQGKGPAVWTGPPCYGRRSDGNRLHSP
jgi:hypothetical protein